MGAWRYRVWANHGIDRDCMEVRCTRFRRNVDVDKNGRRLVEIECQHAVYIPETEGFSWMPHKDGAIVPPFLSITGEQFFTIDRDEGEELLSALLPYRVDVDIKEREYIL